MRGYTNKIVYKYYFFSFIIISQEMDQSFIAFAYFSIWEKNLINEKVKKINNNNLLYLIL